MGKPETLKLPEIGSVAVEFIQNEDCAGRSGALLQSIRIETACSTCLKDDGYFVITTERWAINDASAAEFIAMLQHVAKSAGMVQP